MTFANLIGQRLPWLVGIVVALAMVLLLIMFRSVTIALKAAVMNLLSISAAYGVLVLVTQHGPRTAAARVPRDHAGDHLGADVPVRHPVRPVHGLRGVPAFADPRSLRRHRRQRGLGRPRAARTARVITAAAAIMVVVFLSIALGADVGVKQIGLGLATAVLIDATLVRMVLVPAVMELLGKANWWLPTPLARLLPKAPLGKDEPPARPRSPQPSSIDRPHHRKPASWQRRPGGPCCQPRCGGMLKVMSAQVIVLAARIYDHALATGFARGFEITAGCALLALVVALTVIRVRREHPSGTGGPAAG